MRVLGVDGGQSGIRLRHSDDERTVEVDGVSRLEGDTVAQLADAVAEAHRSGGFPPADRVVLGLTTAPSDADAIDRLCRLVAEATGVPEVWLADDAVTSHAGALSGGWGVSLISGTGVACLAVPDDGEPRIIGGHGYLLGDEGGGFWIGRRGLGAVLRAGEGRGSATDLTDSARRRFGELEGLHVRLHDSVRPVHEIASFAPDVLEAAEAGDEVAGALLDRAADELALTAWSGATWAAGLSTTGAVPLALGGRMLPDDGPLRRRLDERLAQLRSPVAVRTADGSPLDGALLIGGRDDPGPYRTLVHVWTGR
jgi:N-acetylglucosamine kinase-like BadF-type ATPase